MRQPEPDFNPCENNGGCEALCLLVPSSNATGRPSRVCQCPENFILNSDGLTCASNCSSSSFNCKFKLHMYFHKKDHDDNCRLATKINFYLSYIISKKDLNLL